jgi:hypothetical protein
VAAHARSALASAAARSIGLGGGMLSGGGDGNDAHTRVASAAKILGYDHTCCVHFDCGRASHEAGRPGY